MQRDRSMSNLIFRPSTPVHNVEAGAENAPRLQLYARTQYSVKLLYSTIMGAKGQNSLGTIFKKCSGSSCLELLKLQRTHVERVPFCENAWVGERADLRTTPQVTTDDEIWRRIHIHDDSTASRLRPAR